MPARDSFSADDQRRIIEILPTFPLRDQALITTGMATGFRAFELGSLTINHVLTEAGTMRERITLERRYLKHGRSVYRQKIRSRSVPLTAACRAILERYVAVRRAQGTAGLDAPLFISRKGCGLSIWQTNRIVHAVTARAGCSTDRYFGSHSLRKTFARRVHHACGRDIAVTSVALGHSSVLVTMRYIQPRHDEVDAAILA